MDRRIARTHRALRGALLELIEEKSLEAITIQEITDRADTARITFYRHYKDKHELLAACLDQIYAELQTRMTIPEEIEEKQAGQLICRYLEIWYAYLAEQRPFFKQVFTGSVAAVVRQHLRDLVIQQIFQIMQRSNFLTQYPFPVPVEIVAAFMAESQIGLITWWLETDSPHSPTLLAEIATRLMETGIFGIINKEPVEGDISYYPIQI